jgi:NAD(P)-dependent dehydrogenase (short-subunit alcohol dehydrogenase family)
VTLALARDGFTVYAIHARNRRAAQSLQDEAKSNSLPIRCLKGDLTDGEAVTSCVNAIKGQTNTIDAVVHCAASGVHRNTSQLTQKQMSWTFATNVLSIHELLIQLLPMMRFGGRILGITSSGATRVVPLYGAIGSSKGALESLFRYYAQEFAPRGISVNLVCPGVVITGALDAFPDREQLVSRAIARTPTGRLSTPEDVAKLVLFLCSEAAVQIVGQTIVIDGGAALV